jgi:hypothetical protein
MKSKTKQATLTERFHFGVNVEERCGVFVACRIADVDVSIFLNNEETSIAALCNINRTAIAC